ncbi:MAG: peptidyl-prolyl cis-trans isomerase [Longimicrobiales bacterium]|nr:peptidyl-prolyl cis-trans isomerase [Longimicrobiales bacterium]
MNRKTLSILALGLLAAGCGGEQSNEGLVARVEDYTFSVDNAVDLLVDEERLAADAGVVEALADLWVNYTLLAEATATDSMYGMLDFEPMVMRQAQQVMVFQLRDSVIQVDTFVTDLELRERYEAEEPAVELRARHIMFQLPIGVSSAQRDSVAAALSAVRDRILGGENFEILAQQLSQDPGTAFSGGDLGPFGRGDMVAPFEEATLALQPGEISDVVETPMGLHIIRLDERSVRAFEEAAPLYRRQVQNRMVQEAESVFVSDLYDRAQPVIVDGAIDIVRELAGNPASSFSGRAAGRSVMEWEGGAISVGDLRTLVQLESPTLPLQLVDSDDEQLSEFLRSLARRDLLIRAAESEGLRPERDSLDGMIDEAAAQLRTAARVLGFFELDQAPGEDLDVAIARAVEEALVDNLSGATQIVPLGLVGFQLREGRSTGVFEAGFGQVVLDVAQIRAARQLSPVEETITTSSVPDSVGR